LAITVLLILAVLWAAVLVPPVLRSRSESRRGDSLGRPGLGFGAIARNPLGRSRGGDVSAAMGFRGAGSNNRSSSSIAVPKVSRYTQPLVPVAGASTMSPMQRRRRDVLVVLGGAVLLTFVVALLAGSMMLWGVQLLADAALAGYVYLLVQMKGTQQRQPAAPRRAPVRPTAVPSPGPVAVDPPRPLPHLTHPGVRGFGTSPYYPEADYEVAPPRHAVSL
jgi:hypothetical protein